MILRRAGRYFGLLLTVAFMAALLLRHGAVTAGFAAGLRLCIYSVLPALFPFFVVSDLLLGCPMPGAVVRPLAKMTGLKSAEGAVALLLSWVGGYAVCARLTAELRQQKRISQRDAQLLLLLGCCSGPGFVVGCVGESLLGDARLGAVLYVLQLAANLFTAALLVPFLPTGAEKAQPIPQKQISLNLSSSLERAVASSLTVCGCVLFYSVVAAIFPFPAVWGAALHALLEISGGCAAFAQLGGVASLYGCCAALSVLGLSVFSQLTLLLRGTVSLRPVAAARILHLGIFALLVRLTVGLLPGVAAVYTTLAPRVVTMSRLPPDAACVGAVFLCTTLYKARQSLYNRIQPK